MVRSDRITEAVLRPWTTTLTAVVEASTPPLRSAQRSLVASDVSRGNGRSALTGFCKTNCESSGVLQVSGYRERWRLGVAHHGVPCELEAGRDASRGSIGQRRAYRGDHQADDPRAQPAATRSAGGRLSVSGVIDILVRALRARRRCWTGSAW